MDPLNVTAQPVYDNRISKLEIHAYNPYANASLGNSDEIRIPIQQQDLILLPSGSYLYIEGKLIEGTRAADTPLLDKVMLDANSMAFLLDEIRYELNSIEIDHCKNVGITTSIKNLISLSTEESMSLRHSGWFIETQDRENVTNNFNFCVPLHMLLGFCEDYKRVIINARHELILIRARNDINSIFSSNKFTDSRFELYRVQWRIPHETLNEFTKLQFLRIIEQNKNLTMAFRSWELYEYPLLPETQRHTWAVKAATQLEKPRYVILAFRRNKKIDQYSDVLKFSDCDVRDVKVNLNSEFYPYERLDTDFTKSRYSVLYDMYVKFFNSYYAGEKLSKPMLDYLNFLKYGPLFVIDCSYQNESIKTGTVDVKIEIECWKNIRSNTTAYCLIIHDKIVDYNPLTNIVRNVN
ncbi:uncharacterized protein [Prorops nasuta]|uniref:uncharacterized protein n=1 Tax=Prorops nasuta TaxID=863751 RepID=UPI0034CDB13E